MTLTQALRALHKAGKITNPWPRGLRVLWTSYAAAGRVVASSQRGIQILEWEAAVERRTWGHDQVPAAFEIDLDDPATRGCLLELIREATDRPIAYAYKPLTAWVVCDHPGNPALGTGWTEGEAIAAAIVRLAEGM